MTGKDDLVTVANGLVKQEVIVSDATGSCKIVLWEENVGVMEEGCSYDLKELTIHIFKDRKYLNS